MEESNLVRSVLVSPPLRPGHPPTHPFKNKQQAAGIFLVRNAKAGSDFLRRTELLGVAQATLAPAPASEGAEGAAAAASASSVDVEGQE